MNGEFNSQEELLDFIGGIPRTLFTSFKIRSRDISYNADGEVIKHPFSNLCLEQIKELSKRLGFPKSNISDAIGFLINLGMVNMYRFADPELDLDNKIKQFNSIHVPRINNYYKYMEENNPEETFEVISVKVIKTEDWLNKIFYKPLYTEIAYYNFKYHILLETNKALQRKSKRADCHPVFIKNIISEDFDKVLETKQWDDVQKKIQELLKLNWIRTHRFSGPLSWDILKKEFHTCFGNDE